MGTYDNFKDMPEQIKLEGQEISLTFTRNGDGTASVCWNIPKPAVGCSAENQAYDGIVVTVASKPSNYTSTSPVDGTYYNADATADADIHLGDKIDYARVVGALYHDKTTTCITVTDIADKTPYFFSAYAVDKVGRYYTVGTHAYSLPSTNQKYVGGSDSSAFHDIEIDTTTGITGITDTGLISGTDYVLPFKYNTNCYDVTIRGTEAQTYNNLVSALNKEFAQLFDPILGPYPPYSSVYIVDKLNETLNFWDGFTDTLITDAIFSTTDPASPTLGDYWYDPTADKLYIYETAGWVQQFNIIKNATDPRTPKCDDLWFNGTDIYQWDGTIWCKLTAYIQSTNPLAPPVMDCSSYWYKTTTDEFFVWNEELRTWEDSLVIVSEYDPETITTGSFWFNETDEKVYIYITGAFTELNNIRYEEPNTLGEIDNPVANHYWYSTSEQILRKRNVSNTAWVEQNIVLYPTDPTDRNSCDLWWDTSVSINDLFKWDVVNGVWSPVTSFSESTVDPSIPVKLADNAAWYNPTTELIELIMGSNCLPSDYVYSLSDPTTTLIGEIWYNTTLNKWMVWDGASWMEFTPTVSPIDPTLLTVGRFWFDLTNDILNQWNGSAWDVVSYVEEKILPTVDTLWYNTVSELLFVWDGVKWVERNPNVFVTLILAKGTCDDGKDVLCFSTFDEGCDNVLEILKTDNTVISSLSSPVIWYDPRNGATALSDLHMTEQLGVGTDGSPDERRELHRDIRYILGKGSTEVELSKPQIDICIDNALRYIRKYSSYSKNRAFFFLDISPNQQNYRLTDKCVGFNKIVEVNTIYRTGPFSYGSTGVADNSVFNFGALQQLYAVQTFDMLSFHLVSQYIEELELLFARKIMFQFKEDTRILKLHQRVYLPERLLLDAFIERTEQELMKDRDLVLWIQKWAVAEAKMTLSQVRGKYQTLPGPNGSTTLNSQELITQSENEKSELIEELKDFGMQDLVDVGMGAHLIIG